MARGLRKPRRLASGKPAFPRLRFLRHNHCRHHRQRAMLAVPVPDRGAQGLQVAPRGSGLALLGERPAISGSDVGQFSVAPPLRQIGDGIGDMLAGRDVGKCSLA